MKSYLSHLECTACGKTFPTEQPIRVCTACGKVLYPRYDLPAVRREVKRASWDARTDASMWRYFELMPVRSAAHVVTLGEGATPMARAERLGKRLGLRNLYVKDEGLNPTASFKARGLSAAVSKAKEVGVTRITMPSAGNAASAVAAYTAKAGLEAHVFMPKDVPEANRLECAGMGAQVTLVQGHIGDAGKASQQRARELDLFDVSTLQEPYRVEGKKTMGIEIVQSLGWRFPDVILYPTGGGTGILGMWKVFHELLELGWIEGKLPRMVAVQAAGCAGVVEAFEQGRDTVTAPANPHTWAAGLRVPKPFADYLIMKVLRDSGGAALAVDDAAMPGAMAELGASEGIFACPEGAATLVGLHMLIERGQVGESETVVLLNTGNGLKYLDVLQTAFPRGQ